MGSKDLKSTGLLGQGLDRSWLLHDVTRISLPKQLRVYPLKFVKEIYDIFSNTEKVHKYLRNKTVVQHTDFTDHEIFAAMPMGDLWEDAGIASVYFYLRKGAHLVIPDSWSATIDAFDRELSESVPGSAARIQFNQPTTPPTCSIAQQRR